MHSYIPSYLRDKNRGLVLDLLMQHKLLSRAEICKYSKISFPTVVKIVDFFLETGLVSESEIASTSENGLGRKGQLLKLNENAFSTIGIFFEGDYLHIGLVNLTHTVIDQKFFPFQGNPSTAEEYERISGNMTDTVKEFRRTHPETKILGVGVGLPGVIDSENMTFRRWGKLYNFYQFYNTFNSVADLPVYIENDTNAASLGEMILREDPAYSNLLYLSLGTGFGAGIIINNRIWHGADNFAGDIGMALNGLDLKSRPSSLDQFRINSQINAGAIKNRFGVDIQHDTSCPVELKREISEYIVDRMLPMIYNLNYILDISNYVLAGIVTEFLDPVIFDCIHENLEYLHKVDVIPLKNTIVPSISRNAGIVGVSSIALENCLPKLLS